MIVVVIAFIIGYFVISFIIYVLQRGRNQENMYTSGTRHSYESCHGTEHDETTRRSEVKDEIFYSSVLDLSGNFTLDDIRSSYRKLAAQYHPDKVNHLGPKLRRTAEQEMKQINEAYLYFKNKYKM